MNRFARLDKLVAELPTEQRPQAAQALAQVFGVLALRYCAQRTPPIVPDRHFEGSALLACIEGRAKPDDLRHVTEVIKFFR